MKAVAILKKHGIIYFNQNHVDQPVSISFDLSGFKPFSTHAIHIHEYGDMSEGCKSLGPHFNPTNKKHFHTGKGHSGDLINNFTTDSDGCFTYIFNTRDISLYPNKLSVLGRSIVIHQFMDDYGLGGIIINDQLVPYDNLSTVCLKALCEKLQYKEVVSKSRSEMIKKLLFESETTGNASTRIDAGIIALSKS